MGIASGETKQLNNQSSTIFSEAVYQRLVWRNLASGIASSGYREQKYCGKPGKQCHRT
jgi:hypothetical protein